jgi:hypothetical protein
MNIFEKLAHKMALLGVFFAGNQNSRKKGLTLVLYWSDKDHCYYLKHRPENAILDGNSHTLFQDGILESNLREIMVQFHDLGYPILLSNVNENHKMILQARQKWHEELENTPIEDLRAYVTNETEESNRAIPEDFVGYEGPPFLSSY